MLAGALPMLSTHRHHTSWHCHVKPPCGRCTHAGIIRRVAGVLVAAVLLGAALFYVGLQLAFPSYG